jgi:hypothetical protein
MRIGTRNWIALSLSVTALLAGAASAQAGGSISTIAISPGINLPPNVINIINNQPPPPPTSVAISPGVINLITPPPPPPPPVNVIKAPALINPNIINLINTPAPSSTGGVSQINFVNNTVLPSLGPPSIGPLPEHFTIERLTNVGNTGEASTGDAKTGDAGRGDVALTGAFSPRFGDRSLSDENEGAVAPSPADLATVASDRPDGTRPAGGAARREYIVSASVATTRETSSGEYVFGKNRDGTPKVIPTSLVVPSTVTAGGLDAVVPPTAPRGTVMVAALNEPAGGATQPASVDLYGDRLISMAMDGKVATKLVEGGKSSGKFVAMHPDAAETVLNSVINLDGLQQANGFLVRGGKLVLVYVEPK